MAIVETLLFNVIQTMINLTKIYNTNKIKIEIKLMVSWY